MVNSATDVDALSAAAILLVQENKPLVEDAFAEAIHRAQQVGTVGTQHSARARARFLHTTIAGLRAMAKTGATKEAFEDVEETGQRPHADLILTLEASIVPFRSAVEQRTSHASYLKRHHPQFLAVPETVGGGSRR